MRDKRTRTVIEHFRECPEAKSIAMLLLIAEEANRQVQPAFWEIATGITSYINECWGWLGHRKVVLQDKCFSSCTIELFGHRKDVLQAFMVCNAILDYVTYKSLEDRKGIDHTSCPMLDYVFNEIPLQNYLTNEILALVGGSKERYSL